MKSEHITELARYFSMNAIDHSISSRQELIETADKLLKNGFQKNYAHCRNILIVGAGISHNANEKISLATDFAKTLRGNFENRLRNKQSLKNPLEKQLDYLVRVYNLRKEEFETIMLACSRFDNEEVLRELKRVYDIKHVPNLFFEIAGHMFKHRFIDVIINFNFDEILDNIIEDEMSGSEYHSIVSDGDLSEDFIDMMLDHRLKKPVYIKPHGTISHPSTLRFNKAQYFALPSKISDLLKTLFIGNFKEKDAPVAENLKLNLILAGFGMQSNDLNYILNESLQKRSGENANKEGHNPNCNFFVFDVLDEKNNTQDGYLDRLRKTGLFDGIENCFFDKNLPLNNFFHYCAIDSNPKKIDTSDTTKRPNPSLENCFYQLFNEIKAQFNDPIDKKEKNFRLRGIERHLIISELFQQERTNKKAALKIFESREKVNPTSKSMSEYYLLARVYTELALLLVHSNGLLNIRQLKESRVNKYFKLLKRFYTTPAYHTYPKINLEDCISKFGMRNYKYFAKDTFVYDQARTGNAEQYIASIVNRLFSILQELAKKYKNKQGVALAYLNNKKIIAEHFLGFYSNYDWQIKPNFNEYSVSKFKSITDESFLHTDLRFTSYRRKFYLDDNWNINLSVTKGHNWLVKENWLELFKKDAAKTKLMYLIQANFQEKTLQQNHDLHPEINHVYQPVSGPSNDVSSLHWSLHNQHLHLFLKVKSSQHGNLINLKERFLHTESTATEAFSNINKNLNKLIEVKNGIYYQRRLLSKRANPIYFEITNDQEKRKKELMQADLIELLDLFVNYWARTSCNSSHSIDNYKVFINYKIELFESFYKNLSKR